MSCNTWDTVEMTAFLVLVRNYCWPWRMHRISILGLGVGRGSRSSKGIMWTKSSVWISKECVLSGSGRKFMVGIEDWIWVVEKLDIIESTRTYSAIGKPLEILVQGPWKQKHSLIFLLCIKWTSMTLSEWMNTPDKLFTRVSLFGTWLLLYLGFCGLGRVQQSAFRL